MPQKLKIAHLERCIGCNLCVFACARINYGVLSMDRSAILVKTSGGINSDFIVVICKGCEDPVCTRVCPTKALTPRTGGGCKLDRTKCESCGMCKEACILGAIRMDEEMGKPIVCTHCGACARYCPHEVIMLEKTDASDTGSSKNQSASYITSEPNSAEASSPKISSAKTPPEAENKPQGAN